jgi:hypothetical protein
MNGWNWCSKYAPSIDKLNKNVWPIGVGPALGAKTMANYVGEIS